MTITTGQRSVSRIFNVIKQPRRPAILDALNAPVAGLVDKMITDLQCRPLTATLSLTDGKLTVPVGSHHGMRTECACNCQWHRYAVADHACHQCRRNVVDTDTAQRPA